MSGKANSIAAGQSLLQAHRKSVANSLLIGKLSFEVVS